VPIITNTEELIEEQDEIMDMAVDSNTMIVSPIEKALQYWRHPDTNQAMTQNQSVLNRPWILRVSSPRETNKQEDTWNTFLA
jgi:hypothetical protein